MLFALSGSRALWAAEPFLLKKLLIGESEPAAAALPSDSGGDATIYVANVPALAGADYKAAVAKFIGQPFTDELVNAIGAATAEYLKKNDRVLYKFQAPLGQNAALGIFRFGVVVGTYNNIQVRNNRYFSSKLLLNKLGVSPGDEIRMSVLENGVNWANANPFRQVKVLLNELPDKPGQADLIVGVQERLPLRFSAAFDDTGNDIIGNNHYTGIVQYGNLWGKDHQVSYQFTTTDESHVFQSHSLDYRIPLPWHHYLQFNAGYLVVRPTFGQRNEFTQNGRNINGMLRYTYPLRGGDSPMDVSFGIDFKQGNNSYAYGGTIIDRLTTTTDGFQFTTSWSLLKRDKLGAWGIGVNINASPGNINSRNTDEIFSQIRFGTKATYLAGTLSVQRLQNLDAGWTFVSRITAQAATSNLPGSEGFSIGGSNTVRGFDERIYSGDQGFVCSNDVLTPPIYYIAPFLKQRPIETKFLAFYDAAHVFYKHRTPNDIVLPPMASTGFGVRMAVAPNFTLSADYGWQITHLTFPVAHHGRSHIKVVLAF